MTDASNSSSGQPAEFPGWTAIAERVGYCLDAIGLFYDGLRSAAERAGARDWCRDEPIRLTGGEICEAILRRAVACYGDNAAARLQALQLGTSEQVGRLAARLVEQGIVQIEAASTQRMFTDIYTAENLPILLEPLAQRAVEPGRQIYTAENLPSLLEQARRGFPPQRLRFSLRSLFLVVTVAAVATAGIARMGSSRDILTLTACLALTACCIALLAGIYFVVATTKRRTWWGMFLGVLSGLGMFLGILCLAIIAMALGAFVIYGPE